MVTYFEFWWSIFGVFYDYRKYQYMKVNILRLFYDDVQFNWLSFALSMHRTVNALHLILKLLSSTKHPQYEFDVKLATGLDSC